MSIPSSIYTAIGQSTIGTENYYYTDKLNILVPYGEDEFEKSILYSSWNKRLDVYPDLCTNNQKSGEIPVKIFSFADEDLLNFNLSSGSSATNVTITTKLTYEPQIQPKKATMANVFVDSANSYIFGDVGANSTVYSELTSTQKGTHHFYRDIQYDKIIFSFPDLQGFLKNSESKEIINIDIVEFLENPDAYYISSMISLPPARYLWNGSDYVNSPASISNTYYTEFDDFKGFKFSSPFSSGVKKVSMYYGVRNSAYDKGNVGKNLGRCSYPTTTSGSIAYITGLQIGNYNTGGFGERYSPISYDGLILNCPAPDYYVETKPTSAQVSLLKEEWNESNNAIHNIKYYSKYSNTAVSASDPRYILNDFYAEVTSYIDGRFVYNYFAGAGCYFVAGNLPSGITPETIDTFDNIYLGEMDKNGYTTLRFLNGKDLFIYDGDNKHGNTNNDNYNPNIVPDNSDEDNEADMEIGSVYSVGGMVNYYKVTKENLQTLSKLMSNVDVVGTKNLLPNLISLKSFPIPFERMARGTTKTIEIGGIEMTDGFAGTATGITIDSTYSLLHCFDYTVTGKFGDLGSPHFLDFSPFTQVELILPLAGSVLLPDNAMYKSLSCDYVFDIVSGTAIAVVKSNGTIIATIPCTLSQDVPFSAINVGAKTSAMISNITNVAQNIATLGVSVGTGNVVGGISSGIGTIGSIAQAIMTNNQNYLEKFGRTGDMCDFGLVKKAYIKYTRPVTVIPDNFGHTNGYMCNVTSKLSDCRGFTVCDNVDINVSATDTEKRIIKQLLETGIYI